MEKKAKQRAKRRCGTTPRAHTHTHTQQAPTTYAARVQQAPHEECGKQRAMVSGGRYWEARCRVSHSQPPPSATGEPHHRAGADEQGACFFPRPVRRCAHRGTRQSLGSRRWDEYPSRVDALDGVVGLYERHLVSQRGRSFCGAADAPCCRRLPHVRAADAAADSSPQKLNPTVTTIQCEPARGGGGAGGWRDLIPAAQVRH